MEEDIIEDGSEEMEVNLAEEFSNAMDVIRRRNGTDNNREDHEISDELQIMCMGLWDIYNTKSQELEEVGGSYDSGRLERMRNHVRENWSRQDMMDYHMGTLSNNGTIKWAIRHAPNKIAAIDHYVSEDEHGIPQTIEQANYMLSLVKSVLAARGKDEVMFAYITNDYNYWNNLSDEDIYGI